MDSELRDALHGITSQVADVSRDVRLALGEVRDASKRVDKLEAHIFGSILPPGAKPAAPIAARVQINETADAEIRARVERIESLTIQQSKALGLIPRETGMFRSALAFLNSRQGRQAIGRLILIVTAAWGAHEANRAADGVSRARTEIAP